MDMILFDGRLGKDPEHRTTKGGTELTQLNVAVDHYNRQTKERETEWRQVTVFGKLGEFCENKLRKGMKILVNGTARARGYKNKLEEVVGILDVTASQIDVLDWGGKEDGSQPAVPSGFSASDSEVPF